ncbi:MAG: hypothetical protein HZC28_09050 [Spirochaetes bacterium]|nr:hypothetical protein [Spirochaetota bacterium]
MDKRSENNKAFLTNIYRKGPFTRHGFYAKPAEYGIAELPDGDYTLSDKPVTEWVPYFAENYRREIEMLESAGGDIVPQARASTATHIYAAAFGAKVHAYRGMNTNPAAMPFITNGEEADRLEEPDIWKSPTLYRIFEMNRALQRELGHDVPLGPPDLQSGFDIMSQIWDKTDLFCSMVLPDKKEAVHRLNEKCARLLKKVIAELRKEFPTMQVCHCPGAWTPPEMGPWLSNDECGEFGPDLFEEYCMPELVDLSTAFGGLGMHCCAKAEHQFENFMKIPNFYGFNRVASKNTRGYKAMLEYFKDASAPVLVFGWLDDETTEWFIANAPEGVRCIFTQLGASSENAKRWLDRMTAVSATRVSSRA